MKKKPKKQDPHFAYATDHPSGRPLDVDKSDSTLSRNIEIGANGPPKTLLQITVKHNGTLAVVSPANAEYNESGRFFMVVEGLKDGVNDFGLRENSSTSPSDTWELTVGGAEKLQIDSIKDPKGVEVPHGTTTSETSFVVSGQARRNSTIYLLIDGKRQPGLIGVDGNDNWTANTGTQASGLHGFEIKGNYDSGPVSTPPRTLFVGAKETIEDFTVVDTSGPISNINQKITATYLSAEIKTKSKISGSISIKNDDFGDLTGNCLILRTEYSTTPNGEGTFLITLKNPCSKVEFLAKCSLMQDDINGIAATINYYNVQNILLGQQNLLGEAYPGPYIVRSHKFASPNITSIEFKVTTRWYTLTTIDNVKLTS